MTRLVNDRKYLYYICGQCETPIEYEKNSEPPMTCPDCGYRHRDRKKYDIPEDIRYPIN